MNTYTQAFAGYGTRLFMGLLLFLIFLYAPSAVAAYNQQNLVTDNQAELTGLGYAPAAHVDPNLVNPWGISHSATSPFWVSDNGTGNATLYNGAGVANALVVSIPGGNPTGQVFNADPASFQVTSGGSSGPARFLFATEAGIISGWNPGVPPPPTSTSATVAIDNSAAGAIYKGLAIDNSTPGSSVLYAADFSGTGHIAAFDSTFAATLIGAFIDPTLPSGYAPFNIQNLDGDMYVTYAFKSNPSNTDETAGAGLGIVDEFDTKGNFIKRLINNGGVLNAPWGLALAPSNFGAFSGDLLVGNFGDGKINAFDPNGNFMGTLSDSNSNPIVIDGLWGLAFGNGANGANTNTLYFAAGINNEGDGLFGSLTVPEPSILTMMIFGFILYFIGLRLLPGSRRVVRGSDKTRVFMPF